MSLLVNYDKVIHFIYGIRCIAKNSWYVISQEKGFESFQYEDMELDNKVLFLTHLINNDDIAKQN